MAAGIEDAKTFSESYIGPASEGVIYGLSNGWFNTAKGKDLANFEISLVGNASFVNDDSKGFQLNTADYNYLRFQNPAQQTGSVATVFGENDPEVVMIVEFENDLGVSEEAEITLPQGIGSAGVSVLPTAYLQVSLGVLKVTETKGRYFPKTDIDDVNTELYGFGLQYEVTSWIPGGDLFPLHISALFGYTSFKASYDLQDNLNVEGDNQRISTDMNSMLFAALVSTKLKVVNFCGGIGYVSGTSDTDLLGTYRVKSGVLKDSSITNPFGISKKVSGVKATLGTKLSLAFFRINVDYSFQKYNNVSVALNFGI